MDIVERLRDPLRRYEGTSDDDDCHEAADEIERLRDALSFYASFAKVSPQMNVAAYYIDNGRIAAAALKEENNE
jgi:hypothetical protein